jgi:hypothetical protein
MSLIPLPEFSELPLQDSHPPHSCWGLWSGNGFDDQLGSLNYLTDALVLKAMKEEIQSGERVGLKLNLLAHSPSISNSCTSLPLDFISPPFYKRAAFSKQIIRKDPRVVNDDVVSCTEVTAFTFAYTWTRLLSTPKEAHNVRGTSLYEISQN